MPLQKPQPRGRAWLRRSEIFIADAEKNGELRRSDIYLEHWPHVDRRSYMPLLTELGRLNSVLL